MSHLFRLFRLLTIPLSHIAAAISLNGTCAQDYSAHRTEIARRTRVSRGAATSNVQCPSPRLRNLGALARCHSSVDRGIACEHFKYIRIQLQVYFYFSLAVHPVQRKRATLYSKKPSATSFSTVGAGTWGQTGDLYLMQGTYLWCRTNFDIATGTGETLPDAPGTTIFRSELTEKEAGQDKDKSTRGWSEDVVKRRHQQGGLKKLFSI
ncbi:hypothetical protein B0H14DRAFT_2573874 [Mycena olivaceomarginata]|nr:hypothetical protein B0H14DRAFT_2573874 [Mycena olivaceomarginata]